MTSLVRMELLKLGKRPMTWILAILLHGVIGLGVVGGFLDLRSADGAARNDMLDHLTLPGIIPWFAQTLYLFGSIVIAILAASSIGSEYGWGTLRPFLATGMSRARFLAAKLLALALVGLAFIALPLLLCATLAVPIATLNDRPVLGFTVDLNWLLDLVAIVGRCYLAILIPALIAFLIGLAGRSQAAGIGTALGLLIGELVVSTVLLSLNQAWANAVVNFLPGQNSLTLVGNYATFGPPDLHPGIPGEWRIVATLATYGIACLAVAFIIFRQRDVRGAM
jgi:ABC-type transport system involved in multi-copper enzyme maturation permease subunit